MSKEFIDRINNAITTEEVDDICSSSYGISEKQLLQIIIPDVQAILRRYSELTRTEVHYVPNLATCDLSLSGIFKIQQDIFKLKHNDYTNIMRMYREILFIAAELYREYV
jgi:hypothetical protein